MVRVQSNCFRCFSSTGDLCFPVCLHPCKDKNPMRCGVPSKGPGSQFHLQRLWRGIKACKGLFNYCSDRYHYLLDVLKTTQIKYSNWFRSGNTGPVQTKLGAFKNNKKVKGLLHSLILTMFSWASVQLTSKGLSF